jgi:tetratricopeptide (TPR) repeat protein
MAISGFRCYNFSRSLGKKGDTPLTPAEPRHPRIAAVYLTAGGLLFTAVAIGSFFPHPRLWGVNHLSYYHPVVRLAALLLVAAAFLPGVGEWIYDRGESALASLTRSRPRRVLFVSVLVLSAFGLFVAFQSSTELLGDGQLRAKFLTRSIESADVTLGKFAKSVIGETTAPGAHLLAYTSAKLIAAENPLVAWRLMTAVLGGLFIMIVTLFVSRNGSRPAHPALLAAFALVFGGIELFFGYIETYAPMILFTALYTMTALESVHGRRHIAVPTAFFFLAAACHYQALLLAPSLMFVVLARPFARRKKFLAAALGALTIAAVITAAETTKWGGFFLPLVASGDTPGVFTPRHLADIANEILLIVPTIPFLAAAVLSRGLGRAAGSARRDAFDEQANLIFAVSLQIPCIVFLFAFVPELGMARDWDLFILPALGAAAPALALAQGALDTARMRRFFVPFAATALAIVIPWIGINASETKSVERYERILSTGSPDAGYGFEILAMHYEDRGDYAKKAAAYDKAYSVSKNPRHLVSACSARFRTGEAERALSTLDEYLASNPGYDLAREVYIEGLLGTNRLSDVIRVSEEGIAINPDRPYYYYSLGVAYAATGRPDKARGAFQDCLKLDPPAVMIDAINDLLGEMNE